MTNAFEETKIPPGTGHPIGDADISLRHLFVFATVAREGSAASAAGKLLQEALQSFAPSGPLSVSWASVCLTDTLVVW